MMRPWSVLVAAVLVAGSIVLAPGRAPASRTEGFQTARVYASGDERVTRVYIQPGGADDRSVIELRKRLISRGVRRVNLFAPSMIIACDVPESIPLGTVLDDPRFTLIADTEMDARSDATDADDLRFVKMCYERALARSPSTAAQAASDGFSDVVRVVPPEVVEESKTRARMFAAPGAVEERNVQQNSEILMGDVLLRLVLPESEGHDEDWTDEGLADAVAGAYAAVLDYQSKFPNMDLHFVLTNEPRVGTASEPIQTAMGDHSRWIADVMARLGMTVGDAAVMVHMYNNQGRSHYGTDWAFTGFVACSENALNHRFIDQFYTAYAYLGGPYLVIPHPAGDNPYAIDPSLVFSIVFQHEMSHIFWALDEYPGPLNGSTCTDRSGYLACENKNKLTQLLDGTTLSCPGWETVPCIMWRAKEDLGRPACKFTEGQIGVVDDSPKNDIPDVFDAAPLVEFADAAVETIGTPDVTVRMKVISQAVANRNPYQSPEDRVSYAPLLRDATVSINGTTPFHVTPVDGRWDELEEDLSVSLKGITVGTTDIAVVARSVPGRSSPRTVKTIYFLGIRFALFDVDPLESGIRVAWKTVGETFGAKLDLHRVDTSAGEPDTTLLVSDIQPTPESDELFHYYDYTDEHVVPGRTYRYFVRGYFDVVYPDTTVEYRATSDTFEAQGMFPISSGVLASYVSPNPFSGKTQISVRVPEKAPAAASSGATVRRTPVSVVVYDVSGRPVKTIYDGELYAGVKTFDWDGTNAKNIHVPSGVYFLRTQAGPATEVRKVVVVR